MEARERFQQCADFGSKRQFLLDYMENITYWNDKLAIHGAVPVTVKTVRGETETSRIEFRVERDTRSITPTIADRPTSAPHLAFLAL